VIRFKLQTLEVKIFYVPYHGASKSAFFYTGLGGRGVFFDLHSRKKKGGWSEKIVF
jgi:hypothetical protein